MKIVNQLPPLSFAQERLWFLDQLETDNSSYNIALGIRLKGRLDVAALKKSLTEIIRRHQVLRTTFPTIDGQPYQVILGAEEAKITHLDLSALPDHQRQARLHLLLDSAARDPFDLASGPLLRVALLTLGPREHVLALALHHIICDGWSLGVLVGEVASLYDSYSQGFEPALPELPIQYADYAVWQRQRADEPLLQRQLGYWKRKLGGEKPVLELPTDRPRPPLQTYAGARQGVRVRREVAEGLRQIGRGEEATLYMALLAGFAVMMKRYSGHGSMLIGTPVAGRRREEVEGLIGLFVNTVVMKLEVDESKSVREMIRVVKEEAVGAYENEEVSYEKVVEEVGAERETSRSPVVQVMMALQNAPQVEMKLRGLDIEIIDIDMKAAKFELGLDIRESPNGLFAEIEYRTDLFYASTITRMLGHYRALLEAFIADPDQPISSIQMLPEAERRQMLYEWNDTGRRETTWCAHELFQQQVKRSPEAVAVEYCQQRISYRELDERSNQLAHYLRNIGSGPETLIGICLERSVEMIVAVLAVLKSGAAYVPLDPDYPAERLTFMLDDARISVLLTQRRLAESLPDRLPHVVLIDSYHEAIAEENQEAPRNHATADNLAYVIYTSGSTGKPKGVAITHGGLYNVIAVSMRMFDFGEGDHLAQLASLSFDASVLEIFMTLLSGATLHLVSSDVVVSGADLGELLREEAISALTLTPSLLNTIPEEGLIDLRLIVVGGEPCSAETATRWGQGRRFYNVYAPTEATIYATIFECSGTRRASPPIGRPIANMRIYLLDSNLQVVPIGVPGQLRIGGSGLARGYLRRPEMTAERFIPNPFAVEPGERLYTTGDIGRYLPDGNLEFMGRTDDQVKVRGYRIELGEIEAVCLEHPQVREVAVVAREDQGGDKRLVAYYASKAEPPLTPGALREFLKSKLPDYMAPARLVLMRSLPKMPTGKIDRKALPQEARPDADEDFVGPRNPVEEAVAKIWSDALGREQVSVHDNFFDIDGHSLMAARVVYRLRDRFGIELPIRDFFESPTVADLALKISEYDGIKGEAAAPEITRQPRGGKKIKDLLDQLSETPCDSAQPSAGLDTTK